MQVDGYLILWHFESIYYNRFINMTYIYAGTAYNQVIAFASDDKKKHKTIYGPMAREIVNFISLDFNENRMFYSTSRHINLALESGETTCIA